MTAKDVPKKVSSTESGGFPREGVGLAHHEGMGLDHHREGVGLVSPLSHEGNDS
jgi:hypothetical protein